MHIDLIRRGFEPDSPLGMKRRQVVESDLLAELVRVLEIDRLDPQAGEIRFVLLGRADLTDTIAPVFRPKRRIWLGET